MTRIQTLQGRRAPLAARVIERIARRRFGRDMDPLGVYAHAPGMEVGYMMYEQATAEPAPGRRAAEDPRRAEGRGADQVRVLRRHRLLGGAPRGNHRGAADGAAALPRQRRLRRARAAGARLCGGDDAHAPDGRRRAVRRPARALRRTPAGRAHEHRRAGEPALALQPRLRHVTGRLLRGAGVRVESCREAWPSRIAGAPREDPARRGHRRDRPRAAADAARGGATRWSRCAARRTSSTGCARRAPRRWRSTRSTAPPCARRWRRPARRR